MAETDKKIEKLRERNFRSEKYPAVCPECGEQLKDRVWHEGKDAQGAAKKGADLRAWMLNGGRCPRPACNAQIICPTCGIPLAPGATYCHACHTAIGSPRRTCSRCGITYERNMACCPQCGLPATLVCEQDGTQMHYEEKYCPRCRHYNDWDRIYPDGNARQEPVYTPSPLNGSFVITPYGPMFVFDPMPAPAPEPPRKPAPMLTPEPEETPAPAPVPVSDKRSVIGLVFSILAILCTAGFIAAFAFDYTIVGIVVTVAAFLFGFIGIGLGVSGKDAHPKTGIAAVLIGFIAVLAAAAACVWLFLYDGIATVRDWFGIKINKK